MGGGISSLNQDEVESELINNIREKYRDQLTRVDSLDGSPSHSANHLVKMGSVRNLAIKQLSRHLSRNESFYTDGGTSGMGAVAKETEKGASHHDKRVDTQLDETINYSASSSTLSLANPDSINAAAFQTCLSSDNLYKQKKKPGLQVNITLSDSGTLLDEYVGETVDDDDREFVVGEHEQGKQTRSIDTELLVVTPKHGTVKLLDQKGQSVSSTGRTKFVAEDFIELAALGSGSSGCVMEALHLPTLSLVALKMLPVYNKEKRTAVARELQVLYRNLSEMNLVSDAYSSALEEQRAANSRGGRKNNDEKEEEEKEEEAEEGKIGIEKSDVRALKPKRCENLLSFLGAYTDSKSGMINLVIEYMDGGSLEDLVQVGGCQDELILADIARQTLTGLDYLHSYNSVHRDIKPANILCSSNGTIKIADFGISIVLDNTAGFAQSFVGTVCYMSPERITGGSYSFSSDIWSFGLTMLAVAKGRFPIEENAIKGGYWGMIKAICDESPPEPGAEFSPLFASFISRCLQKKPGDRGTIEELLQHEWLLQADVSLDDVATATTTSVSTTSDTRTTNTALDLGGLPLNSPLSPLKNGFSESSKLDKMTPRRPNSKLGSRRPSLDGSVSLDRASFDKSPLSTELTQAVVRRRSREITPTTRTLVEQMQGFGLIEGIRLEHLDRILNKLAAKHRKDGDAVTVTPRVQGNTDLDLEGERSIKLLQISKWQLLADQLHLPVNVVELLARTKKIELKEDLKREANARAALAHLVNENE